MGALATIIASINEDVVAALAAASYPPLTPDPDGTAGRILVGTAALFETTAPPRIIFEPLGSKFSTPEFYSASHARDTLERRHEIGQRTIAAEDVMFNVRCWGAATTGVPVDDYDVTRALYHAVRGALHRVMPGAYAIEEAGKYTVGSNVNRNGREFVFGVTFLTPVLASLLPYDRARLFAPDGVAAVTTDHMTIPLTGPTTGPTETGC